MNEPSDAVIFASARRALAGAAPAIPSPALLAAVRREAERRARLLRFRRAFFLAAAAAAAVLLAFVHPVLTGPRTSSGVEAQVASAADHPADAAVRLLLFDAAEARAVLASASASEDGEDEDSGTAAVVVSSGADDTDWDSLSFADALLAWQEAPLADLAVF